MSTLTHPLLTAFRASKPAFGAWLTLPGFLSARTAASASPHLSWVVIDCEHGATPLQPGAAESVHAIAGLGPHAPSTIVRIPATGACADGSAGWQIKYVLDAGARGVLVPMVSTAAQAKSVVAAARFPPAGVRGFGSPFTQLAWGPGVSPAEYLARANDAVLVLVQIETPGGVQNLEDILAVDGLDGVFIGPYDLSLSLGYPAPAPDPVPEVEQVIQRILASAHAKGKKCAIYCTSGAQAAKRAQEGFDMINVTSDSGAMAESLARNLAAAAGEEAGQKGFGY
ncbi:Phosphoenolpyruvate/pyruvate domain-containing protein [Trametes cingulata]|nr:Phosphoenolpyruvate/pyruvate domain-containing protein [Trametes cingulata]